MSTLMTVQECAQKLNVKPLDLFKFLRAFGYLTASNLPNNQYLATGLFEIKHNSWVHPKHGVRHSGRTLVTEKGLNHIELRLREQEAARICRRDSEAANDSGTSCGTRKSA